MDSTRRIVLGEGEGVVRIDRIQHARQVLASLLGQAQRRIDLLAPRIDAPTFQQPPVRDALARFVTLNPRNSARFLIGEAHSLIGDATQLAELCRRFPSYLSARWLDPQEYALEEMFCVVDATGFLAQSRLDQSSFVAAGNAPPRARELIRRFDALWERAVAVPGLSAAGL